MRKLIFILVAAFMSIATVNAQVAREIQANPFDNMSVSIQGGVSTPLDMNGIFPLNPMAGLRIAKEFTPIFGAEIEGNVWFGDNHFNRTWDYFTPEQKTLVKGTNVGLNGTVNLTNLFFGYTGVPRKFEVKAVGGIGWLHYWNHFKSDAPQGSDVDGVLPEPGTDTNGVLPMPRYFDKNGFTAKTALNLAFNLDRYRKHSVFVEPGVFWNLSHNKEAGKTVQFNQKYAQLAVMVGYTYHFACSNGTHHFVLHDVGALNDEINRLRSQEPQVVTETVIKDHYVTVREGNAVVMFAFDNAELTEDARTTICALPKDATYDLVGTASPEGSAEYNAALAQRRADAVAAFMQDNGYKVRNVTADATMFGDATNRTVIVTPVK